MRRNFRAQRTKSPDFERNMVIKMRRKHNDGMVWMIMLTTAVITMSIVIVKFYGKVIEKQLLSQNMPLPETVTIDDHYLQIEYPWERSADTMREANENEKKQLLESEYMEQLYELALLLDGTATWNTEKLWVDEKERLVYRGINENELSYAVDLERGIVGFGLKTQKETDDAVKKENMDELVVLLNDPLQELYQFLPAVNDIWTNQEIPILDGLQVKQEQPLSIVYDYLNDFPRQVLYYQDVLTVILEIEENYLVLGYDPTTQRYMSCLLITK